MEEADYPGVRVSMETKFDGVITPLKIDISTGDIITPREIKYNFNLMLENRTIEVWAYNLETVLAEKLETVISRNVTNTRMRDFYDIFILQKLYGEQLSKDVLWDALVATAKKRETLEQIETEDIVLDCNLPDGTGFSFCVIICYQIFLPLYFPLSEFVNTGGTI